MSKLTITYYHEVVEDGKGASYQLLDESKFEAQMKYLAESGYTSLFFSELDKPLPKKPIIVSFDDGFLSVYEKAAPIMEKYGVKGNIYLPTAYIGNDEKFMTWEQIKNLQDNGLFEVQAHTHNHIDVRTKSEEELAQETEISNGYFEKELGYVPVAICLPFGAYDARSIKALKKVAGYKYILGSFYGAVTEKGLKKTGALLPRIGISNDDDMETYQKKLQGKLNWKGRLQRLRLWLQSKRKQYVEKYEY